MKPKNTFAKAFQVVSLDAYHTDTLRKDMSASNVPASFKPAPRRRPEKPTIKMPKFQDSEAIANLKAGIHKAARKSVFALMDFVKGATPPPIPAAAKMKKPKFLPGVHQPSQRGNYAKADGCSDMSLRKKDRSMSKGGEGSRGGKIAYHTKSGKPVYQSKVKKMAPGMSTMAHNWTSNAGRSSRADDHATAAKQHMAAAFYQHHAGDHTAAHDHLHHAESHRASAKERGAGGEEQLTGAGKRTMKWVDANRAGTHALVKHGDNAQGHALTSPGSRSEKMPMSGSSKKHTTATEKSLNHQESVMSNTYEDLFKSELGIDGGAALIDCPHCETPITKSEILAKAKATGEFAKDNHDGDNHRGPARGHRSAHRSAGGVAKHGAGMGGAHDAMKAYADSSSDDDDMDKADATTAASPAPAPAPAPAAPPKPIGGGIQQLPAKTSDVGGSSGRVSMRGVATQQAAKKSIVTGSEHVMWVDNGSDAALAKSIAEGSLGQGAFLNMPIDKNSTR